jgi:hypothetical protein
MVAQVLARVWSGGICGGQNEAGAGFFRVLWFPLPIYIPPNSPSSQSPGAGTIGQKWLTCRGDPVWTPPTHYANLKIVNGLKNKPSRREAEGGSKLDIPRGLILPEERKNKTLLYIFSLKAFVIISGIKSVELSTAVCCRYQYQPIQRAGRRPIQKPRYRWEDNVLKWILKE